MTLQPAEQGGNYSRVGPQNVSRRLNDANLAVTIRRINERARVRRRHFSIVGAVDNEQASRRNARGRR